MDLIEYVTTVFTGDLDVMVWANDDSEDYEFRINGAVCARQAYDGIRGNRDDAFKDRAHVARHMWLFYQGPIYV